MPVQKVIQLLDGTIASGNLGDFAAEDPSNQLIDLVYALGAEYRANASFLMNSKTASSVRKLKDAEGRFSWADGLAAGQPAGRSAGDRP